MALPEGLTTAELLEMIKLQERINADTERFEELKLKWKQSIPGKRTFQHEGILVDKNVRRDFAKKLFAEEHPADTSPEYYTLQVDPTSVPEDLRKQYTVEVPSISIKRVEVI